MNINHTYAVSPSIWRTLAACFYDTFLLFGLSCIVTMLALFLKTQLGPPIDKTDIALNAIEQKLLLACVFLTIYAFFVYFWVSHGKTLGMQTWKFIIVDHHGQSPSYKQASIRFFTAIIAYGCFGIGVLWQFIDPQQRTWQDIVSNTLLRLESETKASPIKKR
ncbi:MAG: RDD family protein [Pseudomonadota bacterium]